MISFKQPTISIITPVLNAREGLIKTIESVISQPYPSIQYIVIDGGSTDGTLDVIRHYSSQIDYWLSEPDGGLYDACNKAIPRIRGEGHLYLNAGDYFVGDVFGSHPNIPSFLPYRYSDFFGRTTLGRVRNFRYGMPYCTQAIIFETKQIKYDASFKVAGDYKYYLDHGYKEPLPTAISEGYVTVDFGLSRRESSVGCKETLSIVRSYWGESAYCRAVISTQIKQTLKTLLRLTTMRR